MDALLNHAQLLAQQATTGYLPIENRIAYVVSHGQSYASNGYAIRTQGIAQALNGQGFETLCFVRPGRPWELDRKQRVEPEVQVKGVRYIHSRWQNDQQPATETERLEHSVQQFIELFTLYRPRMVLAASNYIIGLPAWIAAKRLGLPFYNEVRGFWELSRSAREPGYETTDEFATEAQRDTFVARQAVKVFTLNLPMKGELSKRGVDGDKIERVPNGISDLPEIRSADPALKKRLGISEGDKVVGYVGSFTAYEGLDLLIEACEQLVKAGEKIKLLLVGDDQPLIYNNQQTSEVSNKPWLIQTGRVNHEQIGEYYALIDLVVIPRKNLPVCQLVTPMKLIEALSYQKAVLVSDVNILQHYATQYAGVEVFKADHAEALTDKIRHGLNNKQQTTNSNSNSIAYQELLFPLVNELRSRLKTTPPTHVLPVTRLITDQQPQNQTLAAKDINFANANELFYKQGNLTQTLEILNALKDKGEKFDKLKRDFEAFVRGLFNLKGGLFIPPKQPNAGLFTQRKHLLYCLHQSVPHTTNGYSTRSHGIAAGLQQAGWKVNATTRTGFPWDSNAKGLSKGYHQEQVDGVTYTACAGWNLNKTPLDLYLAETADHFLREAQLSGAEVIVAASNHVTALPALIAARRLGLPFVYEVRGLWEVTQASTQPEWANSERFNLMRELEVQAAKEADLVITLTQELADELVSRGADPGRITVVPNAVDAERFKPQPADTKISQQLNLKPGIPVIGYAGSAVAYEGLELLLEALALLKQRNLDFHFVLVGDGKVIDTVKAKAKQLGIEDECRFTGRVPFDQVPAYLSCMDIMPIPRLSSAVTEMVSPLKPLEAMAMAKAVVLSDVSPHKIFAGDNQRAQLFLKDNKVDLANTLQGLMQSPERRLVLGQAARQWIEQQRTWQHVTQDYSASIEQFLQLKNNSQYSVVPLPKNWVT